MSLLPSIVSVLDADITGFLSKMNTATQKMDEVDRLSVGVSKRQVQAGAMGLMAAGGLFAGAGAVVTGVSDSVEKSQATLRQVIENTGGARGSTTKTEWMLRFRRERTSARVRRMYRMPWPS